MNIALGWLITALIVVVIITFAFGVVSFRSLPTQERPQTATYDRFGQFIGMKENPDYHENPGEQQEEESGQPREAP